MQVKWVISLAFNGNVTRMFYALFANKLFEGVATQKKKKKYSLFWNKLTKSRQIALGSRIIA